MRTCVPFVVETRGAELVAWTPFADVVVSARRLSELEARAREAVQRLVGAEHEIVLLVGGPRRVGRQARGRPA